MSTDRNPFTADDYRKFGYALVARDVRRLAALLHQTDIDDGTKDSVDTALSHVEMRVWATLLCDPISGDLIQPEDTYSDGRRVTTTIDWGQGFFTLVNSPDPDEDSVDCAIELIEERWPATPGEPPCGGAGGGLDEDDISGRG